MKVVSLVPSITESLLAWGITPIAVTRFCEVPGLATVGGTKNPDIDGIVALAPDVVFMDKEENRAPDAASLENAGVPVIATDVRSVDDVEPALARLAEAVGVVVPPFRIPVPDKGRGVKVFVPIWRRPWMTVGGRTYGSSALTAAGFVNVYASSADPYPTVELGDVAERRPAHVLAPSEPYDFKEKHRAELEVVGPVRFVDGKDLFWWGVRTPGAVGRLREMAAALAGA
ncbi:MAG TPA: helical backbone metal receptor [Acidimicrobiales bacterium]|nr:helical backbone metal receptor [Acidimicrobiales bacterium]